MKKSKSFLSMVLCLTMLLSMLPMSVFAASNESDFSYSLLSDGTIKITGYNGSDTEIIIPDTINGKQVSAIGDYLFYVSYGNTSNIISVEVPEKVTSIGEGAFARCTSLKSIILPKTLTSIGRMCFYDLGSLTINFCGSSSEWSGITKGQSWSTYSRLTINYEFNRPIKPWFDPTFDGGDGSEGNPYQVRTAEQLNYIRNNPYAHYIQTANIDIGDYSNWVPIGDTNIPFQGGYDGNNYTIYNLSIRDVTNEGYFGLFGVASEGVYLKNVNLYAVDVNIADSSTSQYEYSGSGSFRYAYGGSLLARSYDAVIDNCTTHGRMSISGLLNCEETHMCSSYVGGICGSIGNASNSVNYIDIIVSGCRIYAGGITSEYGNIENCKNYGDISCYSNNIALSNSLDWIYCGGLCASNIYDDVISSSNYGKITAYGKSMVRAGGVCGDSSSYTNIENCTNKGDVFAQTMCINSSASGVCVGGILANDCDIETGNVNNCINFGDLTARAGDEEGESTSTFPAHCYCGGIVAYNISGTVENCYNYGLEFIGTSETSASDYTPSIGRICGYSVDKLQDNYSINTTTLNSITPNTYIGSNKINGASLTKEEIDNKINGNDTSDPSIDDFVEKILYGEDRLSLGQDINGYVGEVVNSLIVYSSKEHNITALDITSGNTNIVEIGTIEIGVGDYITSENEHMATIPLKLKAEGTSTITITSPEGVSESVKVTVAKAPEVKKSIAVFTTEKSLSVNTGDSMWLAFGLMNEDTGLVEEDWRKMAITVSDPTIISLSDYEETEYGYSLEVIGKKQGATNVTITDTETGINTIIVISVYDSFVQTYSYAIDDMKVFYPNNQWEDHIATNIYNLNGLYVNNYQCIKNGDTYNIDFDVYNSRYYAGSVDIYDESGMWLGYEEINKYSDITSLWDTGEQAFYLISNTIALIPGGNDSNLLTYEQESFSKHTHVSLQIPEGGYFTISNNVGTSPGTFFINAFEILFDGAYAALDLVTSDSVKTTALSGFKKSAAKSLADRLIEARNEGLKNELKKKAQKVMLGTMQSEITKITKKFTQAELKDQLVSTDETCSEMANLAENILSSYNISWKHLFQSATGVGESFFTSLSGPAGVALKGCFAITKSTNKLLMATQMATSTQKPYVTVYSSIEEGYINPYGVIVNTAGNMDAEAVLQVFRVSNDDAVDVILNSNNPLEKHELYNICFVKDDQLVQPSGKVTVHIPIPEGMNSNTCKVYRQESDGAWTILDAHIEGNYLVFETDHFSLYSVVGDMDNLSVHSLPNKVVYADGDILDTTGLVLDLNGQLISEGFVCEPMVLSGTENLKVIVRYGNATTDFDVKVKALGGYMVSGNVKSFGNQEENCNLRLIDELGAIEEVATSSGIYTFENIAVGTYTLEVSKADHVTRTYEIVVTDENVVQDVKIHLLGDVNGDGRVNTIDVNRVYAHVRETIPLTGYELECANVAGSGSTVNTIDVNRIYAHVKETNLLW